MTTTKHRKGGSKGANGYGEYQVRYASDKQINFIKQLLNSKQHNLTLTDEALTKLNVQGAGELITNLLTLPAKEGYVIAPTERQVSYAQSLIQDKEGGIELLNDYLFTKKVNSLSDLDKSDVSAIINTLRARSNKPVPILIKEVGAYLLDETIYSIRKGSYSKEWQVWSYSDESKKYERNNKANEKKVLTTLDVSNRLTLEQAIRYSAQTGVCCHCGRTLTLLKSVTAGMGRVCASRYF